MERNQGFLPEALPEFAFDGRCLLVNGVEREVSVHPDVDLDQIRYIKIKKYQLQENLLLILYFRLRKNLFVLLIETEVGFYLRNV